jgi:1-acyl-sn-glycerol-3-phosphate acyltransferase
LILGVLRAVWFILALLVATLVLAPMVAIGALAGARGPFFTEVSRAWARAGLWASGCRVVTHGMEEHVPPDAPAVIASNHVSWFDVFAIASTLRAPYYFVAKKELERVPIWGWAWRAAGHISIDRSNRERAVRSLRAAGEKVREDHGLVVIFPEGTRSRSGRLQPFKKGAFVLAKETGIPLIPVVVTNSYRIMRPDTFIIRRATIHVWFEPPVPAAEIAEDDVEALLMRVRGVMAARLAAEGEPPPAEIAAA